jgi:hypothetical protein
MRKSLYLPLIMLFLSFISAFSQDNKHIVGISTGTSMPWENSIYIDYDQYTTWPDSKMNPNLSVFYEYQLSPYFKVGSHIDYEKTKLEITYPFDENITTKRVALGLHWIGQFPNKTAHVELGGFSNVAFLTSEDWDANMKGIEYGIIVGPAFSFGRFKIALHFQPTFSFLFSNDLPENVLLMYPRMMCKLHYAL